VADQVSEIPEEEYVEEILASPKEYQPKTERGKREKAKRDELKEPVKIAETMVDVTNCEKRLRAIAVKHKGKKSIEYYEHIESINSFVEKMREKRDILDAISLSH
jgi:hypothetical protein